MTTFSMSRGMRIMGGRAALSVVMVLMAGNLALADNLNPPWYHGGPLSVFVHWSGDTGLPIEPDWSSVDDDDPSTMLMPNMFPMYERGTSTAGGQYMFQIPNFIDEMPIKLLRIQLTWVGTTAPPHTISAIGIDGPNVAPGIVTFASVPLVFTQPDGGYQYFDLEFRPNPDFEFINVQLAPGAELVQVVIDSISLPEPATVGLLALGGLTMLRRRSRS